MQSTTDIHRGSVEVGDRDPGTSGAEVDDRARHSWERWAEWPLTVAAVVFLAAYAWPILDPSIAPLAASLCDVVVWVTWWLFAVDYVVRLVLARDRWRFLRGSPIDLITVVLPVLRPLRLLRLVTVLSVLNRYAGDSLRGRVAAYVAGSVGLTVVVASLAVLEAERGAADANIHSIGDALWWAVTTMTTVGYGDRYPVTDTGRLVAVGLMLTGIALIGVVTASLASWLVDRVKAVEQTSQAATASDLAAIAAELAALRMELAEARRCDGVQRSTNVVAAWPIVTHVAQESL